MARLQQLSTWTALRGRRHRHKSKTTNRCLIHGRFKLASCTWFKMNESISLDCHPSFCGMRALGEPFALSCWHLHIIQTCSVLSLHKHE